MVQAETYYTCNDPKFSDRLVWEKQCRPGSGPSLFAISSVSFEGFIP